MSASTGLKRGEEEGYRPTALECPACGDARSIVVDVRHASRRGYVRRRRQCPRGHRYTTHERVAAGQRPSVATPLTAARLAGIASGVAAALRELAGGGNHGRHR